MHFFRDSCNYAVLSRIQSDIFEMEYYAMAIVGCFICERKYTAQTLKLTRKGESQSAVNQHDNKLYRYVIYIDCSKPPR